ncbi:response regulator transcription factor [bacterium SCSIO 12741]|nr:response regulator transcription factor [bacterium SCSIO 12741]
MATAVIIDDVEEARLALQQDLEDYLPDIELVGSADGVLTGIKLIKATQPDIVFLDIHMNDGDGFDLLEIADAESFHTIFTTASDAYAIKAFRFSAIDYLLKPIDPDELMTAVEKALEKQKNDQTPLDILKENLVDKPKKIALHTQEKIHIAELEEIVRCESNGNYTQFHFHDGQKLLVTRTLKVFDQMLADQNFYRVHQSHLINCDYIREFVKTEGGYLVMKDRSHVPISSRKKAEVIRMLDQF